jgi:RNA polymerase sigma factor (sigma-70 family)
VDIEAVPFADLLHMAMNGSPEAARVLHERFGPHLRRVIRRKLAPVLRREFDSQDFLQDVWASFFRAPAAARLFDQPEQLVAYLAGIAYHKVADVCRNRFETQKNNINRQVALDSQVCHPIARTPTPSQVVAEREQWDRLTRGQPSRNLRILELLRQGYTHEQIAAVIQVNEKTVRRLLIRLAMRVPT